MTRVCRQIFCDFGADFTVSDTDGEQPASVMIAAVTKVMTSVILMMLLLLLLMMENVQKIVTGPPTHRGQTSKRSLAYGVVCRLLSLSVTLHCGSAGGFTRAGQAMTSCHLQSDYSSTTTLHGGPVVLRPVRVTPCLIRLTYV